MANVDQQGKTGLTLGEKLGQARVKQRLTLSEVAQRTNMKVQLVEDIERNDFSRIAATIYGKGFIKLFAEAVGLDPLPLIQEYMEGAQGATSSSLQQGQQMSKAATGEKDDESDGHAADPAAEEDAGADLFSFARRRKPSIVPQESVDADSDDGSDSPVSREGKGAGLIRQARDELQTARAKTASVLAALGARLRTMGTHLRTIRPTRLPEFSLPRLDTPARRWAAVIGVLVLLVFLVSGLTRWLPRREQPVVGGAVELRLAQEPPEPYF